MLASHVNKPQLLQFDGISFEEYIYHTEDIDDNNRRKDICQSSKDLNLSKSKFFCLHILYNFSIHTGESPDSEKKAFPMQKTCAWNRLGSI